MFVKRLQLGLKHKRQHKASHSLFNARETVRLRWTTNQNVPNIRAANLQGRFPMAVCDGRGWLAVQLA